MRRYVSLIAVILIGALIIGAALWKSPGKRAPAPTKAPPQLQPTAPSVKAAMEFLGAWSKGDAPGVYALLTASMKKLVTEKDFAAMIRERKFTTPQTLAHVETANAAYVIAKVQSAPPAKKEKPLAGFSLLLRQEDGAWKVAQIQEEEKVWEKYADLRLSPGKSGGWDVTYQNEKGQAVTLTLPEL